ncbi:hypothetical protein chiPu_0000951 [Chiloscyllium punctatum]|uniref:Uncharacterized protein n=1 Tax=Chiloscyllium punctatum TaxID=137246 RepID=A0A401RWQ1_CHIPU|nr:hypothetical protein [Chiloscyllium punctatum]
MQEALVSKFQQSLIGLGTLFSRPICVAGRRTKTKGEKEKKSESSETEWEAGQTQAASQPGTRKLTAAGRPGHLSPAVSGRGGDRQGLASASPSRNLSLAGRINISTERYLY